MVDRGSSGNERSHLTNMNHEAAKRYYERVAVLCMVKAMGEEATIVATHQLFDWDLPKARAVVKGTQEHCRLVDGLILRCDKDGQYLIECDNRTWYITRHFLREETTPSFSAHIQEAMSTFPSNQLHLRNETQPKHK